MSFVVDHVDPDGPAAHAGARVGDVLLAVNGMSATDAGPDELPSIAARVPPGQDRRFTLLRASAATGRARQLVVRGASMGVALWDKVDDEETLRRSRGGVYVTAVTEGQAAAAAGVCLWDTLVAVNGTSVRGMDLDQVGDVVGRIPDSVPREYVLERHLSGDPTAAPTVTVVTNAAPGQQSGVSFNRTVGGGDDLYVEEVLDGSKAMADGVLLGDLLLSVNGVTMRGADVAGLVAAIQRLPPDQGRTFVLARPRSNVDVDHPQYIVAAPPGQSMGLSVVHKDRREPDGGGNGGTGSQGGSGGGSHAAAGPGGGANGRRLDIAVDTRRVDSTSAGAGTTANARFLPAGAPAASPAGLQVFEKKYSKKLHRAMFNELLRQKIADVTEYISFAGFDRNYDPVLEQFVFVNRSTGEVKSCFLTPDTNRLCFFNHRTKDTEVTEHIILPPEATVISEAVARKRMQEKNQASNGNSNSSNYGHQAAAGSATGAKASASAPAVPRTPKQAGSLAPLIDLHLAHTAKQQQQQQEQQQQQAGTPASSPAYVRPAYASPRRLQPHEAPRSPGRFRAGAGVLGVADTAAAARSPSRTSDADRSRAEFTSAYSALKSILGRGKARGGGSDQGS